jgi:hypothetical protein
VAQLDEKSFFPSSAEACVCTDEVSADAVLLNSA